MKTICERGGPVHMPSSSNARRLRPLMCTTHRCCEKRPLSQSTPFMPRRELGPKKILERRNAQRCSIHRHVQRAQPTRGGPEVPVVLVRRFLQRRHPQGTLPPQRSAGCRHINRLHLCLVGYVPWFRFRSARAATCRGDVKDPVQGNVRPHGAIHRRRPIVPPESRFDSIQQLGGAEIAFVEENHVCAAHLG